MLNTCLKQLEKAKRDKNTEKITFWEERIARKYPSYKEEKPEEVKKVVKKPKR